MTVICYIITIAYLFSEHPNVATLGLFLADSAAFTFFFYVVRKNSKPLP